MQITPLACAGAEITGVDIRRLTDAEFAAIKTAYADHGIVFFRDQSLSEEDHITFARRFGPININRFFLAHERYPEIALVLKEKEQKTNIGGGWHTDHSYDAEPAMGSVLVARQLPDEGGDTWFASMYTAYDTLDEATRQEISGLRAVHSAKHIFGSDANNFYKANADTGPRIGNAAAADVLEDVTHPVVITHPLSGRKALFVNPAFTTRIAGYTDEQSNALLMRLFSHAMKPDHAHRFKWQPGSVAFWDNRSTWHWAMNDYHGERRLMHRITIEGCALN
ncbi:MAG: TauD/TfdA family dioxygenase [Hyphomonas sp.]|uniref:TauD/TfdA dioxygenase family protein n=1 Tax=Hyphomonas sp. TaxID=87 RepID=UPI00185AB4E0|nr:TauD/TfdA family dioxygenase [Hyphomonas sp.]MBU3921231.1 TauD/TfdA family dioxygenase [Alphaproteobacteria bacterium]MBA3067140.1 TauD/TfdA family dioxygenase [Hyphomonas sp.]MBU4063064.1 TauD/TfdA family dioxygenase [Alphaproteobacteria bacterium]MBU4164381.1 TauD/TfdA family dioxygenase [Alphaproteobacteria bacterium]MBU4568833.1 TauD/TfdA family dioxygenase [Alphaproteobacteria bacterium]